MSSGLRLRLLAFLIQSAQLEIRPIVKYSALSLFADRFYPSLSRFVLSFFATASIVTVNLYLQRFRQSNGMESWLLHPIRESNLQLFALISVWISSKVHDSHPLSVKSVKSLGDKMIKEQCFTIRDFSEAEVVLMQVLNFEIGISNIAFKFLEELCIQFKGVARVGKLVNFAACMDIMDLLYEKEETSSLYNSPRYLAASILVVSYVITVPRQRWEFPLLPWVKFVTGCKEDHIVEIVRDILEHVFEHSSVVPGVE